MKMRKIAVGFFSAVAVLVVATAPTLAKNNNDSKAVESDDKPASSSCVASQLDPDGTWKTIQCREVDSGVQGRAKDLRSK
jgi:uncharacterized membrane protein YdfJ with MMPL/SSD domain